MTAFSRFEDIPHGRYGVIMADPPWHFRTYSAKAQRSAAAHYRTMSKAEICAFNVAALGKDDCALLLWGTSPNLPEMLEVLEAWDFTFKGKAFSWAKTNPLRTADPASATSTWFMGMGYGSRSNTEDCWLATRGRPKRLSASVRELIVAPRREHSRKPDEAFARAQELFGGPYLELFSRQEREGWDSYGDQVTRFPALSVVG